MRLLRRILRGALALAGVAVVLLVVGFVLLVRPYRLHKIHVDGQALTTATGNYRITIQHDGRERYYILHVPPGDAGPAAMPLIIALHGGGGIADTIDDLMQLTPIADREHFLVAFPNAIGKSWNDARPDKDARHGNSDIDDVGFIEAMIDNIETKLPVDRKRVYAMGISNGGFMSTRLACEAADRFAAVGVVDATANPDFLAGCRPQRPISIVAFDGTSDPIVPFKGGRVRLLILKRGHVASVQAYRDFWLQQDGCGSPLKTTDLPDTDHGDGSHVSVQQSDDCRSGAGLAFYTVTGGGHTWPGGKQYLAPLLVGKTNRDVNASELMWRFFAAHPMP